MNSYGQHDFNPRSREGSDIRSCQHTAPTFLFQSTLPRGERQRPAIFNANTCPFQSTLPRGERRLSSEHVRTSKLISIHAPARGATEIFTRIYAAMQFQSTLPRGERRLSFARLTPINSNFNPRSREGSDYFYP